MSATVLSFFRPAPITTGDWSQQELAEFYRVEAASVQAGLRLSLDRGLSDEGDPWLVFCREDGEVFLHFARIDGLYVVWSMMIDRPLTGPDFRALLTELVSRNPSVLPLPRDAGNGRRGAQILMHPAALLAAIVATACLFSSMNEAVASELDTGSHQGGPSEGGANPDSVPTGDAGHAVPANKPHGLAHDRLAHDRLARDGIDRELSLITGVILACIATYATEHHAQVDATVSPLSLPTAGTVIASRSVSDVTAAYEKGGGGHADASSRSPATTEDFRPLAEAATSAPTPAHLQDLRSGISLSPGASPVTFLPIASEPAALSPGTVAVTAPVLRGSHPVPALGSGNGALRPADPSGQRERAAVAADQAAAGGDSHGGGGDRGGDAPSMTSAAPAASDPSKIATTAPAGDGGASRSTAAIGTDTGSTRNAVAGTGTDPGKGSTSAAAATPVAVDSTKTVVVPAPDPVSVATTLTKALAPSAGLFTLGTIDPTTKGIAAIFSDAVTLSSKTVSLLLHALVDIQPTASSKISSDLTGNLAGQVDKLAGLAAPVEVGTPVTGSGVSSPSGTDPSHTVSKTADAISASPAAAAAVQPSTADATKVVSASGDPTKTVVGSNRPGDHSADAVAHAGTTPTSMPATGAPGKTGAVTGLTEDPASSTTAPATAGHAAGGGSGAIADATASPGGAGKAATADAPMATTVATGASVDKVQPVATHQADQSGDLDALHAVAALTSSSNTISRAVSVSLGASATVLDAVQLRIIDLFLQSTPDAKFRTVDNTLEIYDPSASRDVSSHAAVWDIGGGAFVRVIGIIDTHVVS